MNTLHQSWFKSKTLVARWRVGVVYLIGLSLFLASGAPLHAQTEPEYDGAYVLMVVDQSGSMRGFATCLINSNSPQPPASDPANLRFQATEAMIPWLGDWSQWVEPEANFELAVLAFGHPERSILLDWTRLPARQDMADADWDEQRAALRSLLGASRFGDRDFCNTNFRDALRLGQEMFDDIDARDTDERFLRAVIIVTDGAPCVPEEGRCNRAENEIAHLQQVRNLVATAFPAPDYRLYLIAISNPGSPRYYWGRLGDTWRQIVPEARIQLVETGGQLGPAIRRIVDDIFDSITRRGDVRDITGELRAGGGVTEVFVYPYLAQLQINIFLISEQARANANNIARIFYPDGSRVLPGTVGVRRTASQEETNIEVWTILNPSAGDWRVEVDNANDVEAVIQQAYMRYELVGFEPDNASADPLYRYQQIPIEPYLFLEFDTPGSEASERPIILDPAYPFEAWAQLSHPLLSQPIEIPLAENTQAQNAQGRRPQLRGSFIPEYAGTYELGLCGYVSTLDPPENNNRVTCQPEYFTPLDTTREPQPLNVRDVNLTLEPSDAMRGNGMRWVAGTETEVCLKIEDAQRPGQRVPNLGHVEAFVTISYNDSAQATEEFILDYQDEGEPCAFAGMIRFSQSEPDVDVSSKLRRPTNRNITGTAMNPDAQTQLVSLRPRWQQSGNDDEDVFAGSEASFTVTEVRPIRQITFRRLQPSAAEATSNIVHPWLFWQPQPLTLVFEVVDELGNPVDLSTLTEQAMPLEIQNRLGEGSPQDVTNLLTAQGINRFSLSSQTFGVGTHHFAISGAPLPNLACACAYDEAVTPFTWTITRTVPLSAILTAFTLVGLIVLIIVIITWFIVSWLRMRMHPLEGELALGVEEMDNFAGRVELDFIRSLPLQRYGVNTVTVSNLPSDWPVQSLTITNRPPGGASKSQEKRAEYDAKWAAARQRKEIWVTVKPKRQAKLYLQEQTYPLLPAMSNRDWQRVAMSSDGVKKFFVQYLAED